ARNLVANRGEAAPFLKERLQQAAASEAAFGRWVAELDSDDFGVRERATRELASRGAAAELALRLALEAGPPPEARRGSEEILDRETAERVARLSRLLADLDSREDRLRRGANQEFSRLGVEDEPALRKLLASLPQVKEREIAIKRHRIEAALNTPR